jgi:peptidoglycan hydrolase FlgJ
MTQVAPLPPQTNGLSKQELQKIDKTSEDFEAVFITEMLKPMFEALEVDPVFGGGKGEEVFRDLQLNEYGKMISKQGGIGLADNVRAQLIHLQLVSKGQDAVQNYRHTPQNEKTPVSSISELDVNA